MAAYDYYNSAPLQSRYNSSDTQNRYSENPFEPHPPPPPPSTTKPYPTYSSQNYAPESPNDYESPYNHGYTNNPQLSRPQPSQYSISSLGRPNDNEQYADNIPLKSNGNVSTAEDDWRDQNTKYNPASIESQRPGIPEPVTNEKKGWFNGRVPWVVYFFTLVQCSVFIGEIVKNSIITGSPIEIHPRFNYMIGPSINVLINMGARYVPCMRTLPAIQGSTEPINWPCPNTTTADASSSENMCTLADVCGFTGFNEQAPNQWFRFITPMFLHAGIIHIGINMLMQMTMGREMEKQIGSLRFALVYVSSGIFGFVLGGNFAATGIASTGASGALFGVLGLFLLDLVYTWRERRNPFRDLGMFFTDIVVSLCLGLLPGVVDNFSHIGGLLMGLVLGTCVLHSPNALRERIGESITPYQPMHTMSGGIPAEDLDSPTAVTTFAKKPVGFFKGRKPLWWAWWLIRAGALIGVLVSFVVLLNNFYKYHNTCSWCKYLSCLPIKNWCDIGNLQLSNVTTSTRKRDMFGMMDDGLASGFGLFD